MSTSHRSYEEDLPDDILELIDHTTRGVRRLYEATRHTESRHKQRDPPPRRWPWSRAQALPASSTTEGRSGVTTTNTTLSSDGAFAREQERRGQLQREPRVLVSKSHGSSRVHSANSSALEESEGPRQCRRWKETFKSLLADPHPPPRSASVGPHEIPNIPNAPDIPNIPNIPNIPKAPEIPDIPDIPEVPAAPNVAPLSEEALGAQLRALRRQREEDGEAHRAEIAHMRAEHQRELLEQSRAAHDERQRASEEITSRLLASFTVKQKVLRAELESERTRGDEAERSLAECRAEFADATARHCALQSEAAALSASIATLQRDIKTQREAHERDTKALKEQYEAQLQAQREAHERDTKAATQRTEEAFADAARSYESLVRDAGEKLSVLERVTRRHRQLRTAYAKRGDELKALRTAHTEVSTVAEALTRDAEKLRQVLARREHDTREEKARRCAAEAEAAESLRRAMVAETDAQCAARERDESNAALARLEQQVAQQSRQLAQQSQQLAHVQELEQAAKQLAEELEQQSQQTIAQRDAEMEEVRRAAAQQLTQQSQEWTQQLTQQSQQSQETIASLKRQLKEKDARLGALATAAAEPVQRLRVQLEDERGRRAQLEEQFAQYKQRAKAAEEAAMREIRREQARAPSANRQPQPLGHKAQGQQPQLSPTRTHRLSKKRSNKTIASRAAGTDICAGEDLRTPTDQRAQSSVAPPPPRPHSHMWRAVSVSTASATRSPPAVISKGVNGKDREDGLPRGPWESVGSISNISCSSAYCSSDEGTGPTGRTPSAARNGAPFHKRNTKEQQQQQQVQEEQQLYPHSNNNNINNEIHYNNGNGKEEDDDDYDDEDMDRSIARHEQMLREFHQSAAEVFRKITGNRDEFLAKCTSVVRSVSPSANRPHAAIARTDASASD